MPKKSKAKTLKQKSKPKPPVREQNSSNVQQQQVVNVRVGGTIGAVRKRRPTGRRGGGAGRGGGGGGGDGGLAIFSRPPIVATQNLSTVPPAPVNEYNELLRALATERRERMAAAPPLAPNTTPLTTNEQRNEILRTPDTSTPMTPIIQAWAVAQEAVVDRETWDDPLTNENMFVGSSRLAQNISQKLPVSNFDYNDVEAYDDENDLEQEALENQAAREGEPLTLAQKKYDAVSRAYEQYINFLRDANERYLLGEAPKSRRFFNSIKKIKDEIRRIQELSIKASQVPRKASK